MNRFSTKTKIKLYLSLFFAWAALAAMLLFKHFPRAFFPGYRHFSAGVLNMLSIVTSVAAFSVWDILLVVLVALLLFWLFKRRFANIVLLVTAAFCFAVFGWLLNHYAPPLSENFGLKVEPTSEEDLIETTEYMLDKAVEYSLKIDRDDYDFYELAEICGRSYMGLEGFEKGASGRVKRFSLIGEYLMYNGIVGMFMPLTAEASVPYSVPDIPLPYSMVHEAAHRLGIASEQEANFAAFVACSKSDDKRLVYSGYYEAFIYCYNALYRVDKDAAIELYASHEGTEMLREDMRRTAEAYAKYDSPLQQVSDKVNDTYLKAFGHESGVMSYGEVVDYLIAYYKTLLNIQEANEGELYDEME